MFNLYNVLYDITTTVPVDEIIETVEEEPAYSITEMVIWYSLFVLMIAAVIVYIKITRSNKLSVSKIEKMIDSEIKRIEDALNGKKEKNTLSISGVYHILNISKMEFIDLRDKTSLPDMDEILEISDATMKMVRKGEIVKLSNEGVTDKLNTIMTNLKTINEKLKVVEALVG